MCLRLIAETDARSVGDSHSSCIFQQDGTPAHRANSAKTNGHQIRRTLTLLIGELSLNARYKTFHPKPKNTDELMKGLLGFIL